MNPPVIKTTTDYSRFKRINSNREISRPHLRKLITAIQQKNLLHLYPLIINTDREIIDGQHRLKAAQELNLPVYYLTDDKVSKSDIALMNSNRKSWGGKDYIGFFAEEGVEGFSKLHSLVNEFPKISITCALRLMEKGGMSCYQGGHINSDMRAGKIDASNYDMASKIADVAKKLSDKYPYAWQPEFMLGIKRAIMSVPHLSTSTSCYKILEKKHLLPKMLQRTESCSPLLKEILKG